MKALRSLLMALALLMMLAIPALAGGEVGGKGEDLGDITISVSCTTDPETVSIANNLDDLPISIVEISSIDDPRGNEPFFVGEEIAAGDSVTFESGSAAAENVLTEQFIFDNENLDNEGVIVRIGPEPILDDFEVGCNQSPETFEVLGDGATPDDQQDTDGGKTPDNQQDGDKEMVTKTFELTLNGTVPEDRAFGVAYGTFDEFEADEVTDVIVCGQPDPQIGDVVVSDEDCVGDGETYTYSVQLPEGTELYFTYLTAVEGDEENTAEPFFGNITFEGPGEAEVLDTDFTNTAWYTFSGGASDKQETPDNQQDDVQDDQQGEMPEEMPETGAGALAPGAAIPVGNAAVGLTMLVGVGYAVLRCR